MSSSEPLYAGYRVYGESITAARHSSGGRSTEIATTCGRGTITSWTSLPAKSKTL